VSASESRQRTELVGVLLTADEMVAAQWYADRAGVTVPTWLRRQLLEEVHRMAPRHHYRTDAECVAVFLAAYVPARADLVAKDGQR